MMNAPSAPSISRAEVERFAAQAAEWWNPHGSFRFLHELGPLRLSYIKEQAGRPLRGLRVLDVGCGGGLLAEAMAREGALVTGLDACEASIAAARAHAAPSGLPIDYRCDSVEALAETAQRFDLITALEIVEHVADLPAFMKALGCLLRPEGTLVFATVNRTRRSFLFAVVAAEYLLGWIPAGTHDWDSFVPPAVLADLCEKEGLFVTDCSGVVFRPFSGRFMIKKGQTDINYLMSVRKEKEPRSP